MFVIHFMCFIKKNCKGFHGTPCLARIFHITTHKNDNLSFSQDYNSI